MVGLLVIHMFKKLYTSTLTGDLILYLISLLNIINNSMHIRFRRELVIFYGK